MKLLVIRLRLIGDVVFTTPAVHALKRRFPGSHLTYLVEASAAPIVALNPNIDELIVVPRRGGPAGLARDLALARRLRRARYDLAIDFHGGPRSSLLAWLSGAPIRIGYEVVGRSWMYTRRVPRPRALRPRHSVENQWDLLAALGVPPPSRARNPVEMGVDPDAAGALADRLARAGVGAGDELLVIHVSAGNPFRRWPAAEFSALAAALAAAGPARRIVVTSGPSERQAADQVIAGARTRLPDADRARVLSCGDFSLAELRALVERAALYIGGDSGPLHVASTSQVPIVGLYGPTLPVRSEPWRDPSAVSEAVGVDGLPCRPCDQRRCAPGDFRCLTLIGADRVVEAAERALARARSKMSERS